MKLLEDILHRIHQWIQRRERPLELLGPFCPGCKERIDDPANALTFDDDLYHDVQCVLMIPTILRQPKRLQDAAGRN